MSDSYGQMSGVGQPPMHPPGLGQAPMSQGGNPRPMGRGGPIYASAPRQMVMHQGMPMQSMGPQQGGPMQPQYHMAHQQPNNRTPPNSQGQPNQMMRHDGMQAQQLSSMPQMYRGQQTPPTHNQQHLMQAQKLQMMQGSQSKPPYGQSPYNPHNQQPPTPQQTPTPQQSVQSPGYQQNHHQQAQMQYQQNPPQMRYAHVPANQQTVEVHRQYAGPGSQDPSRQMHTPQMRSMTPQNAPSPIQRKNTGGSYKPHQIISEGGPMSNGSEQYVIQTSPPVRSYDPNVPTSMQGPMGGRQMNEKQLQHPQTINYNNTIVVSQPMQHSNLVRHPLSQRPVRYTPQMVPTMGGNQNVRYAYPMVSNAQQQSQPAPRQSMPGRMPPMRPTYSSEYRQPQMVQVIRTETAMSSAPMQQGGGYRMQQMPNNGQNFAGPPQSTVYYRQPLSVDQQPHAAIRQALGHQGPPRHQGQPIVINRQLAADKPTSFRIFKQPSVESMEFHSSVPSSVEPMITEILQESQSSQASVMSVEPMEESIVVIQNDPSPAKKAKPSAGKVPRILGGPSKAAKSSKPSKKATNKAVASKAAETNEDAAKTASLNPHAMPLITEDVLSKAAGRVNENLVLEDEVKAGIMIYMEDFIDQLIRETGRATTLRKSTKVQLKDMEYALRTKLKISKTPGKR